MSDGLSESVIDRLSQLQQLKVISRNSSFKYRGNNLDLQAVANGLDVQAIVVGRVAISGDNLIIRAELVDALENRQLWSESYNRRATDLQAIQGEIAQIVTRKLRLRLTGEQETQLAKREGVNSQAYESMLKGRFHFYKGGHSIESLNRAIKNFQEAIDLEPDYALAYAELSSIYRTLGANGYLDPKEMTPKAESAALKAVELDDKLAEAHVALANVRRNSWQWDEAQEQYQRAIDLNPNLLMAHSGYAQLLSFTGRHEQAIAEAKRARELDPLVPQVNSNLAQMLYFARRYEEAVEAAKRAIELDQKNQSFAYYTLGDVFYVKGMYREAIAAHLQGCEIPGYTVNDEIYLGAIHAKAGNLVKARASLEKLLRTKQYISPAELAILYAALGKPEQAFVLLEKAFAEHDLQLIYLGVDPYYDSLRSDPRFVDLLRRVGLPQ
ncbi:MAG: tetratricopeptide repeat protein [Acidobacteriota bacterium]